MPLALLPCGAPKVGTNLKPAASPRPCPKAGVDAEGRLNAGMLGSEAAGAPEGAARLALSKPGELLAFIQLPAPAFTVGWRFPNKVNDEAAEAALVEACCVGRLLTGGAKLSGAAAPPEAPAAGRSMQGSRLPSAPDSSALWSRVLVWPYFGLWKPFSTSIASLD